MNASDLRTDAARDAWPHLREENAGGARACDFGDHQYGRRVEAERSWTVYHVFTGIPAHANGASMIGLSQSEATRGTLCISSNRLSNCEIKRCPRGRQGSNDFMLPGDMPRAIVDVTRGSLHLRSCIPRV
ncbi:hypothetical protein P9273_14505 [Mesorhizobium sp. WSM4935]|uniref:hypothetical protein n=1 Tax=Mesorhizobium sp. WSM4935 TaxID=3038547 RepID=UPI000506183B|nr:hypothetical protein [Mesorhizobium sp. WSM4935]MDG4876307.1 hypothetical protein [Mesorhizobium sp. WSM4935]CDX36555.1 conserved hypothetical protein [Mesorhizobium sp. SOD10]